MIGFPVVDAERRRTIVREVSHGSKAHIRFFALLIAASMIASFGLIANSTAVIIGAMLVSPLMMPIFGVALGMLRGNPKLLGWALWSEAVGIVLAVGAAYLVGLPQISFADATPEMLARTQPSLLDLLVAIFAGFAGAYAMLDERVSPALPGVAIATAIVPPLSTCGLCLSLGAWAGAAGAMLLFLANFVSILVVALFMFWVGGFARQGIKSRTRLARQFAVTAVAFVVIAVILTNSLLRITHDRFLKREIHDAIETQLALKNGTELDKLVHRQTPEGVQILATVRSYRTISPTWVTGIEEAIESAIGEPADLVVRTIRSRDICSIGASLQAVKPNLDGVFLVPTTNDFEARESLASQVVREYFESEPGFELTRVEYGLSPDDEGIVVAYANAIRRLSQQEFHELETRLQLRFEDPKLHFFVRMNATRLQGRDGPVLVEWINIKEAGPERVNQLPDIEQAIYGAFKSVTSSEPLRVHFNWADQRWRALVEVFGGESLSPEALQSVQQALPEDLAEEVELLVWRRSDVIVTESGFLDYDKLIEPILLQRGEELRGLFRDSAARVPRTTLQSSSATLAIDD